MTTTAIGASRVASERRSGSEFVQSNECECDADYPGLTECACNGNGYAVACWLEEQIVTDPTFPVPTIKVHSANPVGVRRINQVVASIAAMVEDRR